VATRFYLPTTGTPSISPAYGSGWVQDPALARVDMVTTRISSAFANIGNGDVGDSRAAGDILLRQFISAALAAQTISGTIKGVLRGQCNSGSGGSQVPTVRVAKCDSTGSSVTEILAITKSDTEASPPGFVVTPTTYTNRRLEEGTDDFTLNLASTGVSAGDRLIVEIGWFHALQYTSSRFSRIEFGDNSASDLAEDETGTSQDNPWVEFSMDLAFDGGGGAVVIPSRLMTLGVGR